MNSNNDFERNAQELFRSFEEWIQTIDELKHVAQEGLKGFRDEFNQMAFDIKNEIINDKKNQQHEIKTQHVEFQDELRGSKAEIKKLCEILTDQKPK